MNWEEGVVRGKMGDGRKRWQDGGRGGAIGVKGCISGKRGEKERRKRWWV
jgi:hypothetical protein